VDSTLFLKPLLADAGAMTERPPDESERGDIAYGREVAKKIAGLDIGQTIVVADRACLAVEAMEGTDATIERAASLSNGRRLVVIKVSKPNQDMRFDVPVVGLKTIEVMRRAHATVLAVDAGKTLLFERRQLLAAADAAGIAVFGMKDCSRWPPTPLPRGEGSRRTSSLSYPLPSGERVFPPRHPTDGTG
jgi:hypothetical protein